MVYDLQRKNKIKSKAKASNGNVVGCKIKSNIYPVPSTMNILVYSSYISWRKSSPQCALTEGDKTETLH